MPSRQPATPKPGKATRSKKRPGVSMAMRPVNWVRDFLRRPLRLERRGLQLHVVLGPLPAVPDVPAAPVAAGEALRRGHADLQALLRRHPETRHLMRHLGFIEQSLGRAGSRALQHDIPVEVLRKGLEQLDLLVRDEPSDALTELRARIAAVIRDRAGDGDAPPPRAAAVQVSEASHSLFDEMERSWTGQMPLPRAEGGERSD